MNNFNIPHTINGNIMTIGNRILLAVAALVAFSPFGYAQEPKGSGTVVLRAARLIDGRGGDPISPGLIVVTEDKIVAVGSPDSVKIPEGAKTIDLGDVTLLPGFIDCHTHIIGRELGDPANDTAEVKDNESFGAILGVGNARKTLMAGFTTIRNVGAPHFDDMALRKAVNEGRIPGPRMRNAGHGIGITGGHADSNGFKPGLIDGTPKDGIANGVEECRAAVRYQVKYGADVIKIVATGGVLSEGDAVGVTQYTLEEMKALVDESRKLDRKVAAHAHGTEGIKLAVTAGVSSIEHGSFLDEEGAKMMKAKKTYLVPTLMAGERVSGAAASGILKGDRAEKAIAAAKGMRNAIKLAVKEGVPIALGTDAAVIPHGTNGREFFLMVDWGGMKPMDAIVAGTRNAADLLGWLDKIGTLESGKLADIVAVPGNPLDDIDAMTKPVFVMKNGVVYKGEGAKKE
jgi:imidazolonepropionase-like amidohydrolase